MFRAGTARVGMDKTEPVKKTIRAAAAATPIRSGT
jgi:hypothetical protein